MKARKHIATIMTSILLSAALSGCNSAVSNSEGSASAAPGPSVQPSVASEQPATQTPSLDGYNLLWSDEFDGNTLNPDLWNVELRQPGWTNEELQEYTDSADNVFVRDGDLVIKAIKTEDENGNPYYTSGKVTGFGKTDFMYGKVVVRAKVPEGQGLWPAVWMMPTDERLYGSWPKCGEIDIMEVLGNQPNIAYGTIHYGNPHAQQQGIYTLASGSLADDFHDYSVEWEPGEIRYYVDDELYYTVNDWFTGEEGGDDVPYPAPFNQNFYVQMNLAVGGTWPGNPDATTDFDNAELQIDYVRVYQKPEYDTNVTKPPMVFRDPTEDGNLIYNGDFSEQDSLDGTSNWNFLLFEGGEGSARISDNEMVIDSTSEGTEQYSVQLVQPDLPMEKGKTYRLTFDACAAEDRKMIVCVSAPKMDWIRYLPDTSLDLTTDYQTYSYDFTMNDRDDNAGRLEFNMGAQGSTAQIKIKNVRIEVVE
ncbi:MAG: family 16 glycosylhydrolase [Saccharofermentans sp.]|nr:family 16 glycosylhydrolase [Mageeibacillus sp.]MCI1263550.1 family 16 glycosylhydrolase [Saccharofermentans sp.]MCI1274511.1 family 16 glycosylhydrolase [Saccharofermentans sp.]MCI2044800.1 family 16 glycosylhydrolase [Mageeibacillus sp.]